MRPLFFLGFRLPGRVRERVKAERRRGALDLDRMCTLERDRLWALDRDIWRVFLRIDLGRLVSLFSFFWRGRFVWV